MRRWSVWTALSVVLLVLAAACGGDEEETATPAPTGAPTGAATTPAATATEAATTPATATATPAVTATGTPVQGVTIVAAQDGEGPDYAQLTRHAAVEILKAQGIDYEVKYGFDTEAAIQQVVQGQAQVADTAFVVGLTAIQAGAPIRIVTSTQRQSFAYAAKPEIDSIAELSGKTFAVHSEVSFTKAVTDALIKKYQLQDVDEIIMPGSEVRVQALAAGQIDATTVDLADLIRIGAQSPGAVKVLSTVSQEFPALIYTGLSVNADWADKNPEALQALVAAYIEGAERLNSDRDYALSLAEEWIPDDDPQIREQIIDAFLEAGIWNTTDLTEQSARDTMQFLYDFGSLEFDPAAADLASLVDLRYLDAVRPAVVATATPTGPTFENVKVTIAVGGDIPDYGQLIRHAAADILKAQGIEFDIQYGFDTQTAMQQVAQGQAQLGDDAFVGAVAAIDGGAPIKIVSSRGRQSFAYASKPEITSIDQLSGKTIAVHSEVSFTKAVTDALIKKYGLTDIDEIIMPGSEVRVQALAAGQIDATTVDLSDLIRISAQDPDAIRVLSTVSQEFPELIYTAVYVNEEWAKANPDVVKALTAAYAQGAARLHSDREYALSLAGELLPDDPPELQEKIVDAFIEAGIWNAPELTEDTARATMQFLYEVGAIEADPATADLAKYIDLQYMQ